MQFDLKQFLRTGRVPYTAALECDLSGWDWPGYEPVGPVTGEFGAALDENGKPVRWKIQNSWSDENGSKGYYLMSAAWFERYVYQVVIRREHLSEVQRAALDTEPGHLPPWDPMGTLADR